jgi:hypothetical protein
VIGRQDIRPFPDELRVDLSGMSDEELRRSPVDEHGNCRYCHLRVAGVSDSECPIVLERMRR